jgi:hypothetical protein
MSKQFCTRPWLKPLLLLLLLLLAGALWMQSSRQVQCSR